MCNIKSVIVVIIIVIYCMWLINKPVFIAGTLPQIRHHAAT